MSPPVCEVMGVLNVTPDSFSDGGRHLDLDDAIARVAQMIDEGARCIDVGGESTRPGAGPVDPDEEQRRVIPVLEAVAGPARDAGVRLSIDTRNEATARAAVAAGATLLNDVGASLWPVAAELGVGWVAMHMAGDPRTMQRNPRYDDVVSDVRRFLCERARTALDAGVEEVWVDPGIGFGKTTEHNLELLARLDLLVDEGHPVLVGTSRKRFLGELLGRSDLAAAARSPLRASDPASGGPAGTPTRSSQSGGLAAHGAADASSGWSPAGSSRSSVTSAALPDAALVPVDGRLDGSLVTATWAMSQGVRMVRAHDVAATVQAATVVSGDFG